LEFSTLSLSCEKDFQDALEYLNQALAPAAYLVEHSVSIADFAVWAVLHGNYYSVVVVIVVVVVVVALMMI